VKRIVVVGTGTGVGKTHAASALAAAAVATGRTALALKPIESGVGLDVSDADRLASFGSFHVKQSLYALARPVSPHRAAWDQGLTIDLRAVVAWVDGHPSADMLIVETAGGLLSPLAPPATNLDLTALLRPTSVVLVAMNRLGVLHEVAACLAALRSQAPQLPTPFVLLQSLAAPDVSSPTNPVDLLLLGPTPNVCVLPYGPPNAPAVFEAAIALLDHPAF
jgi:dethiobiotin synthetase